MQVIGTNGLKARKYTILRYTRTGLFLLGCIACISIIAIGTLFSSTREKKKIS